MAAWVASCQSKHSDVSTWTTIWATLAWSFQQLYNGTHPLTDHEGRPWPPGSYGARMAGKPIAPGVFFGVVHRITGDLEWCANRLGCQNLQPNVGRPCAWRSADRDRVPFKDLRMEADWVGTIIQHPQPRPNVFPVWGIIGISIFTLAIDLMHCGDLGILLHFIGTCIFTFVFEGPFGGTRSERVDAVWHIVQREYAAQNISCRFSRLELGMFCKRDSPHSEFPLLKAKAAESRSLLPVVLVLCNELNTGSERDQTRLLCAVHLSRFYATVHAAGHVPTPDEYEKLRRAAFDAMLPYMKLSFHAASVEGQYLWNIVNKHHLFLHLALQSKHLNPECVWAYPFEDLMGRSQRVAMACKRGVPLVMVPSSYMIKYRRVLHCALGAFRD